MAKTIFLIVVGCLLFVAYVKYLEKVSVFYPTREVVYTPEDVGLRYEDVSFQAEDGVRLNGWFIPSENAVSTLLFLHGNGGNISDRLDKLVLFNEMGVNTFIIDYRGYGRSEGSPTEEGIYRDAVGAYDHLTGREDLASQKIVAYGESLGGVVAVDLASRRELDALVVEGTFSSAADMSRVIYPFVPTFLLQTRMDSMDKIRRIPIPKLFLHSPVDEVVPFTLGRKLYDAAVPPKKFVELDGGHADGHILGREIYVEAIHSFLSEWGLIRNAKQ